MALQFGIIIWQSCYNIDTSGAPIILFDSIYFARITRNFYLVGLSTGRMSCSRHAASERVYRHRFSIFREYDAPIHPCSDPPVGVWRFVVLTTVSIGRLSRRRNVKRRGFIIVRATQKSPSRVKRPPYDYCLE